jgi:hypothetical protein
MKNIKTVLISGAIAGTLDATAAILFYAKQYTIHSIAGIFRFIARGIFGSAVQATGAIYPFIGLFLHFLIATIWSAVYLLILNRVFKPGFLLIKVILFGCLVWTTMNGFIMPVAGLTMVTYSGWSIMKSFTIILFCVSLPICLIAERKFGNLKD